MLYNIYKTDGTIPLGITDWKHLRVMRLDYSERNIYNHRFVEDTEEITQFRYTHQRKSDAPLKKIGFIGRDFHESRPSGQLTEEFFLYLSHYNEHFEIYFYCLNKNPVGEKFSKFAKIRKQNDIKELGSQIYMDKIDILIDMQGYMIDNFKDLLLKKPAPVQMHWLGYPGTLGLSTIDYLVADETIIPGSSQKYYREKIAYMPECYQANSSRFIQREQWVTRKYFEIPEDAFVFTHFNSDYKVDRKIWFVWMDILKAVPNSVLVFTVLTSNDNDMFLKQLLSDVPRRGVDPKRVIYLPKESRYRHFNRLQLFNLGLDTYRINGHTTNADLICAGLPFVTYTSDTYHNRVGASILKSLDLEELVCHSYDEYSKKIIDIATNKDYYAEIKEKVVNNREKILFNSPRYTRKFVDMIYCIWNKYSDYQVKEVRHYFPEEENLENKWKKQAIQNIKLGDFNNHYYGTKTHEWIFHPGKKCKGNILENSEKRNQYLKDYANTVKNCIAFNMNGVLYDSVEEIIDCEPDNQSEKDGIWVLEKITEKEPDLNTTLNKDYQLPKICLYYHLKKSSPSQTVSNIVSYLFYQTYLNAELLIIGDNFDLPEEGKQFILNNNQFVYFHNNKLNENLDTIFNYYTNTTIRVEISDHNLQDAQYIEKLYEEKIKPSLENNSKNYN